MTFELEPVKRDKLGRKIADYDTRHFYEKIAEELLEAHEAACFENDPVSEVMELLDVMTACATRINSIYLTEGLLEDLQKRVIDRNADRGYFDD